MLVTRRLVASPNFVRISQVGNIVPDRRAHVHDRSHLLACNGKRNDARRMVVNDRNHIRARFQYSAMNKSFRVRLARRWRRADNLTGQSEFHDVFFCQHFGCTRPRHEEMVRIVRMTNGNMPEGIENIFFRQYPVCGYQLLPQSVQVSHVFPPDCYAPAGAFPPTLAENSPPVSSAQGPIGPSRPKLLTRLPSRLSYEQLVRHIIAGDQPPAWRQHDQRYFGTNWQIHVLPGMHPASGFRKPYGLPACQQPG